jgi:hypothetical protein
MQSVRYWKESDMGYSKTDALLVLCAVIALTVPVVAAGWLAQQAQVTSSNSDAPLPACLPHDVLCQLSDFTRFNGMAPELSERLLDLAWHNYFARD